MTTQKKKRIMRDFAIDEISGVTLPAQKGARMVIMKRADEAAGPDISKMSADEIAQLVLKGKYQMTTPAHGHVHLIDVTDEDRLRGGGNTLWCDEGCDYHRHPYIIGKGGEITIGMMMGHTHEIMSIEAVKAAASPPLASESTTEKGEEMDTKEIAKLQALAVMTDDQKAHYGKLDAHAQENFIAATPDQRAARVAATVEKSACDNALVYTAKNGAEYRKSDDPRLVQMAKDRDADMAAAEVQKAAQIEVEAINLAKSWTHMGEPMEEKIAKAKTILAASPEVQRVTLASIEAHKAALAPLFKSIGARDGGVGGQSEQAEATQKLNEMAQELSAKDGSSFAIAYDKVLQTQIGARLYSKVNVRLGSVH